MKNDFHLFTHVPSTLSSDGAVAQSMESPDFQTGENEFIVDNRVSNAALLTEDLYDELFCQVVTGGNAGAGNPNQNAVADAKIWLPSLKSADSISEVCRLTPAERISFTYQKNLSGTIDTIENIQTCYVGHYHDRDKTPPFLSLMPYQLISRNVSVPANGGRAEIPVNVDGNLDILVRAFFMRYKPFKTLVNIRNQSAQNNLTSDFVMADNLAYGSFFGTQNLRMQFLPWIAPRNNRYVIEVKNLDDEPQTVNFSFWGHLVDYPIDAE